MEGEENKARADLKLKIPIAAPHDFDKHVRRYAQRISMPRSALRQEGRAHLDFGPSDGSLRVVAEHIMKLYFAMSQPDHSWLVVLSSAGSRIADESIMIFFVLSGFFISGVVQRLITRWTWKNYQIDRLSRLYVCFRLTLHSGD